MTGVVYFPTDEFNGTGRSNFDLDLAADYLELSAFFSETRQAFSQDIVDALELASDGKFKDVDEEMRRREDIASGAISYMSHRRRVLRNSYPFMLSADGNVVGYSADMPTVGQAAYIVSLVLSNLKAVSPLLFDTSIHPADDDIRDLRQYFQYFATAALAAEVGGPAWSFGHPRPDGTGFLDKLKKIWSDVRDGTVSPDPSAPDRPQDDQVDVFARREHRDPLPGFQLAVGQVATGADWKQKSILPHADKGFYLRWFSRQPVTRLVPYHVIPFARPDNDFRDDVLILGNVLHRLRVPYRVDEAEQMVKRGVSVEAFELLDAAIDWVKNYAAQDIAA